MNIKDCLSWLLALATVGAIIAGAYATFAALRPPPETPEFDATDVTGLRWGRDFFLTGHDGRPRELADFRGKALALYFGYVRCPDVCPLTMATLGQAVRLLGTDGKRVQVAFVTVDPRHDKPAVLKKYVRFFHEDFLGLYGGAAATARTAEEFRIEKGEHHSIPVFLFDPSGRLRLVAHPGATAESIAHDMRLLIGAS
jgi:protein SCO1/2